MYLAMVALPFLSALVSGLWGRAVGTSGAHAVSCGALALASALATVAFVEVGVGGESVGVALAPWVEAERLAIAWEFAFDPLTVTLCVPVLYIATLIHVFSIDYMRSDPHVQRFFAYLSLFTFFMVLLVSGANYWVLFVGWEGIGVASYLLINFWFTRVQANKAAVLALTMNRVGDMGLSVGFFALFAALGSLDYGVAFDVGWGANGDAVAAIGVALLVGAMAKSAQVPLHSWLPGSMEGPTPVSALIHAATLVTAGLYLLVRSSPLLECSSTVLLLIALTGATTALFAATCGLVQNDLKRIVAFSTISQLGYMVMAVGVSEYGVALMHVVNHAFFKALLFLGAGAIIHSVGDQQDVRRMGGLVALLPFTYAAVLVGTVALLGLPWLSGYYSKDFLLELAYAHYTVSGATVYGVGSVTAGLTAFYSVRLIVLVFFTAPEAERRAYLSVHEARGAVVGPLVVLGVASVALGYMASDLFTGAGSAFLGATVPVRPGGEVGVDVEWSVPLGVRHAPTWLSLGGAGLAFALYHGWPQGLARSRDGTGRRGVAFLSGKYGVDVLYNRYAIGWAWHRGYVLVKALDRGVLEAVGPHGLARSLGGAGGRLAGLDVGRVTTYALYVALGVLAVVVASGSGATTGRAAALGVAALWALVG